MELKQVNQQALARLGRVPAYYDGLDKRLGFETRDGRAFLVHVSGVSFRQDSLKKAQRFCSFDRSPPVKLVPEPTNPYDANAIQVLIGVAVDDLTGQWTFEQAGFLPKKRCPTCTASLPGKMATSQVCPECEAEIGVGSDLESFSVINAWVVQAMEQGMIVSAGVDNVTTPQTEKGNCGLDVWLRIDEPTEGMDDKL
jgi:hypothetical protein